MKVSTEDNVIVKGRKKSTFLEDILDITKIVAIIIITFIGISLITMIGFFIYKHVF